MKIGITKSLSFLIVILALGTHQVQAQVNTQAGAQAQYERGQAAMIHEDWFGAVEYFLECWRLNSAHAGAAASLAECYYELGIFDQALIWVRRARVLARGNISLINLEAFTLIALGHLEEARVPISEVLAREPNNREALFAQAELDIALGRTGDAVIRYRDAARRFPDDRRLLISLALVLGSLGNTEDARLYIDRALLQHSGDYRVYYYAAYLASRDGRLSEGIGFAEDALHFRPGFVPAISLMASLHYRLGHYDEAIRICDQLIGMNRNDSQAWYLKGIALTQVGRPDEAMAILSTALTITPENEFSRMALEELLLSETRLEDPVRARWAAWNFNRAREFRSQNLLDQALFEYRRGLRLYPYAPERREYAELLRLQGYPARYFEEIRFLQSLGMADQALNDAVESYNALLSTALFRRWGVDPVMITRPHWKVAVFALDTQTAFIHADAALRASSFIRDLLVHDRNIGPMDLELVQTSFASAFRTAREAEADYFLIVSVAENELDISITGDLYVARTGAAAASFRAFRTGMDRLRFASRGIVNDLSRALPFRAELLLRRQNQGLIDKGRADGVQEGMEFDVVQRGRTQLQNEGIGLIYSPEEVVGRFIVESADEEVSAGELIRQGFFDRISSGDEIFIFPAQEQVDPRGGPIPADPELRALLRTLR
ncbi:MAG: tetratricopeptide repeat protein [Treponema sp.]|nr:tetratricopeptide repeat protein [Treponema sp.]